MRRRRGLPAVLLLTAVLGAGPTVATAAARPARSGPPTPTPAVTASATTPCVGSAASRPSQYDHVLWIWFENKSYAQIVGSAKAPYINKVRAQCGLATNYHNITHPSLPNYLAATSGGTNGTTSDCGPAACPDPDPSLFGQLRAAGRSWKTYAESMPANCRLTDANPYIVHHNPATYFTKDRTDCQAHDVPMGTTAAGALRSDLTGPSAGLPEFGFLVPNICNDMHSCPVSTGDRWLQGWLPVILSSPAYAAGRTAVIITWDEGKGGTAGENCAGQPSDPSCRVATIVVAPSVPAGRQVATHYDHYSLLKTTEQLLGLSGYLHHAGDAGRTSMRTGFGF